MGAGQAVRTLALAALRGGLERARPCVVLDEAGYAASVLDTLLPLVAMADFEADLRAGDGHELQTKMRAAHASSGLAVNVFAPFRRRPGDLVLPAGAHYDILEFERRCPTGLRGGRAPNLDVLASGPGGVVGIESKLTEYLTPHRAAFSPAYGVQIRDKRRDGAYFAEMQRLLQAPDAYRWLDAAQLVKHAFGLAHAFPDRPVTLLYLYWEPADADTFPVFAEHRQEVLTFAARVAGSIPAFAALSYAELWQFWRAKTVPAWLDGHVEALQRRYGVALGSG